jgi:hypothetical protein
MITRYNVGVGEHSEYIEEPDEGGEWVKYEDVENILTTWFEAEKLFEECAEANFYLRSVDIKKVKEIYDSTSDKIESRWKQIIGFGCGYFHSWEIQGDLIVVTYERPSRQGGGISDERDRIPLKCFEVESIEESKKLFKEYIDGQVHI